jgi:hypothetical protein
MQAEYVLMDGLNCESFGSAIMVKYKTLKPFILYFTVEALVGREIRSREDREKVAGKLGR